MPEEPIYAQHSHSRLLIICFVLSDCRSHQFFLLLQDPDAPDLPG